MTREFCFDLVVRSYERDSLGHVNNATFANYLEEAAVLASDDAGYTSEWYKERGEGWVIRQNSIEYLRPATFGDRLKITTWIAAFARVRSERQYRIERDGETILRGCASWVYIDRATGRPRAFPKEYASDFAPNGVFALERADLPDPERSPGPLVKAGLSPKVFRWRHQVFRYELDVNGHVNNAIYLNWLEEAKVRASEEVGWPLERTTVEERFAVIQTRHDIEYFQPAFFGDEIEVTSRLYELRKARGAWLHEIRRTKTGELLARDYSGGAYIRLTGDPIVGQAVHPIAAPPDFLSALLGSDSNEAIKHFQRETALRQA